MSKRAPKFERHSRDYYPTPPDAVLPLIPHLSDCRTFAEPCAGDGSLIDHLTRHGLICVYRGDISTGQDAAAYRASSDVDVVITNPPWSRRILLRLIHHLRQQRPTWLLLPADWAHNRYSAPFLVFCSAMVSVGRVKWIPDSPHIGMDNVAWYKFEAREAETRFFGRDTDKARPSLFREVAA